MAKVTLELDEHQANALKAALDAYVRIGIGQLEILEEQVRFGHLPCFQARAEPRTQASRETCDQIREQLYQVKGALGYPRNGSHGIGHPHVSKTVHRSYEVYKVLSQALALARDPEPALATVDYDGLLVRYTDDPAPRATVAPT